MAATLAPLILSQSTDGRPIKVTATAIGLPQSLHSGPSAATKYHTIDIYGVNTGSANEVLTLLPGGVTDPDDKVPCPMAPNVGPKFLCRVRLKGNATPLVLKTFASTANVINVWGEVSEYVP